MCRLSDLILSVGVLLAALWPCFLLADETVTATREFRIDYDNDQFLKDGEPFRYVSGSLHYFRTPSAYWRDLLRKFRAAGLNAVCTYIEWSQHEPYSREYDFSNDLNLTKFIQTAEEEGLLVILRPGPYICAERDLGGLPSWMISEHPDIRLRTSDPHYQYYVSRWFSVLMPILQPLLYGNGGPVIMMQVENEYGSYFACDRNHTAWLRDLYQSYVGTNAVLFTTDGGGTSYLRCGKIEGVYATVDFGPGSNLASAFAAQRAYEPRGPAVNSEFYAGWLSHWQEKFQTVETQAVTRQLNNILAYNASVNIYMFYGGTNFAFLSGANYGAYYQPQLTSYDYDAPLSEAGDPTDKYYAVRNVIEQYLPLPNMSLPQPSPKGDYGVVQLSGVASLTDADIVADISSKNVTAEYPKTFEQLNHRYGFVLYQTTVPSGVSDPALLNVQEIGDRAYVLVNKEARGVLSRAESITSMPLEVKPGDLLQLLVENQGRINYGTRLKDIKGLLSTNVTLSGHVLQNWNMATLPFHTVSPILTICDETGRRVSPPAFYKGQFVLPEGNSTLDTFLDPTGWAKGVAFINDHNLGRYWPRVGPQITLYVPGVYLRPYPQVNDLVLFELEDAAANLSVTFTTQPVLNMTAVPIE